MKWILLAFLALASGCVEGYPIRDVALRIGFASGGLCSATAVSDDVLLSAAHCFKDDRLTSINGQPAYALKLVNDGHDHVLVRVSRKFKHWTRIGPEPVQGQHVRFIGQPAGLDFVYREVYVAQVTADEILYDGNSFAGDSGSGFMDAQGRVVGVLTGSKAYRTNSGFTFALVWSKRLRFSAAELRDMR